MSCRSSPLSVPLEPAPPKCHIAKHGHPTASRLDVTPLEVKGDPMVIVAFIAVQHIWIASGRGSHRLRHGWHRHQASRLFSASPTAKPSMLSGYPKGQSTRFKGSVTLTQEEMLGTSSSRGHQIEVAIIVEVGHFGLQKKARNVQATALCDVREMTCCHRFRRRANAALWLVINASISPSLSMSPKSAGPTLLKQHQPARCPASSVQPSTCRLKPTID